MELNRRHFLKSSATGLFGVAGPLILTSRKSFAQGPAVDTSLISQLASTCLEQYNEVTSSGNLYASSTAYSNTQSGWNSVIHNLSSSGMTSLLVNSGSSISPYMNYNFDSNFSSAMVSAAQSLGSPLPAEFFDFGDCPAPPTSLVTSTWFSSNSYWNTMGFSVSGGYNVESQLASAVGRLLRRNSYSLVEAVYRPQFSSPRLLRVQSGGASQGQAMGYLLTAGGTSTILGGTLLVNAASIGTTLGVATAAVGWTGVGLIAVGLLAVGYVGFKSLQYLNNGPAQTTQSVVYSQCPANNPQCIK